MSTQLLDALSRLSARRFGSFADAATSVFDLLESAAPGGSLVLGQVDWDEGLCRVIDARGDGVSRGTEIPLAKARPPASCLTPMRSPPSAPRTGWPPRSTPPTAAWSVCCSPPGRTGSRPRAMSRS